MSSITSFNTAQASSTTPSKIVDTNTFYGTMQPVGLVAFPPVSTAEYPHIEVSLKNSRNIKIQLQQSSTDEVDGNGNLVTQKTETIQSDITGTGVEPLSTTSLPLMVFFDVAYPFFRVVLTNEDAVNSNEVFLTTRLVATRPSNANIHYDSVLSTGLNTDANGVIQLNSDGRPETKAVTITDTTGRLRVDAEVTIDDLEPLDDGVAVYGSSDGSDRLILKTDATGKLETNTSITSLTLTPADDGVAVFGSSNGTDRIIVKTDANGKVIVEDMDKLEINANKAPTTSTLISSSTPISANNDATTSIDLGTAENRNRNIAFMGEVDVSVNNDPKIIMSFSDNNTNFYSDGTYCSFYKKSGTAWEFCFQRSNIGLRYVKLVAQNATTFNKVIVTQSKN